jgi:hypothetical protein
MNFQPIIAGERQHEINGVPGRYVGATVRQDEKPGCFCHQRWISVSRPIRGYGAGATLRVEMRFDDDCRNGHNSFAITAEVRIPGRRDVEACGCLHEEIAKVFPELAPLIKWHLVSADGPMHYIANTVYLAGDRDCRGLRKGETRQLRNGRTGEACWELRAVNDGAAIISSTPTGQGYKHDSHLPLYALVTSTDGERPPVAPTLEWVPTLIVGEGKARELDAARRVANWPEATDAQLCAEPAELRAALEARLPALLAEFRAAMVSAGFLWSPEDAKGA